MENYSDEQKRTIKVILRRMFTKAKESQFTYRQLKVLVRAKSHVTIWRWFHGKSYPSQTHIHHIKKFLGYTR